MSGDKRTIFYSWQSELPNKAHRGFIEKQLKAAIKKLNRNDVVISRDTLGDPGSPHIAEKIYQKIVESRVVVADVTVTNKGCDKCCDAPNANVLLELGYAVGKIGWGG